MPWPTLHFAALGITFTGSLLLALFGSAFELNGRRVSIKSCHGWLAVVWWAVGFLLFVIWEAHAL